MHLTLLQPQALEEHTPSSSHLGEEAQLTLNVCFRLMLSEGCTAATRKLSRGMLPRMLSCFSSVGERGVCARVVLMQTEGQGALQPYSDKYQRTSLCSLWMFRRAL